MKKQEIVKMTKFQTRNPVPDCDTTNKEYLQRCNPDRQLALTVRQTPTEAGRSSHVTINSDSVDITLVNRNEDRHEDQNETSLINNMECVRSESQRLQVVPVPVNTSSGKDSHISIPPVTSVEVHY